MSAIEYFNKSRLGDKGRRGAGAAEGHRLLKLPAEVISAKVLTPIVVDIMKQDGDSAVHRELAIEIAAQSVGASARRADGDNDAFRGDARDGRKPPINPRANEQTRADRQTVEGYFIFGRFHVFRKRLCSEAGNWIRYGVFAGDSQATTRSRS